MRLLLLLVCLLPLCHAAQILAFFPMPAKSHHIFFQQLLKGLAAKGHQITYVTPFSMSEPYKNIEEILVENINSNAGSPKMDPSLFRHMNHFKDSFTFWSYAVRAPELVLRQSVIQEFLRQKRKFDVILLEIFFVQHPFIGLTNVFQAPVIDVNTNCGSYLYNDFFYNPNIYSYVTDNTSPYSDRKTLYQRLMNTLVGLYDVHFTPWYFSPYQEHIFNSNFNTTDSKTEKISMHSSLQKNVVASIFNCDPVLGYPKPLMPNTIQVAGITVQPRKPLPQDLQKFMDEADSGVIYFSFGSGLKWEFLTSHKEIFIQAFDRLPQRVLWKFDGELQNKSLNLRTKHWFPQADILAHPNCRLFITHGGYLSTVETVDAAVPVIVVPFFADQFRNAHLAEVRGFGVQLNFDDITPDVIVNTVQEILSNKSYSDNAKKLSTAFNDRVASPLDKAVHLVEYVIRHKNYPGFQTGAKELMWFQYFSLDVIAIIFTAILVTFVITYKTIRCSLSIIWSRLGNTEIRSGNPIKQLKSKTEPCSVAYKLCTQMNLKSD